MTDKLPSNHSSPIERLSLLLFLLLAVNIGLLVFLRSQVKTIGLLKGQQEQLEQDKRVLESAENIYDTYKNDIDKMNAVFPDEERVLDFLQLLERLTKEKSNDSAVRFGSLSPIPEGDNLFLLFTISMKTDLDRYKDFMKSLEELPYMTHVIATSITWVDQKENLIDASLQLKLYVQNPFTTR